MTRARNIAGFSTITTTPSPVHVGPIGVLTATRIDGEFNLVDLDTRDITAQGIGVTNLQVSGITTGLNVSGIITAQNGINFNGTSTGLNVSGIGTIATLNVTGNATISGNATIGGVLTYEDVTNVDSVGVVTARGLSIFGNTTGLQVASGISTFQAVTGTTGTFSAAVSGTTGTFSGAVSGTTGTFSGDVSIADKIIHTGDTNTAIRFPAADTITAETGGTERLRIDSDGELLSTCNNNGQVIHRFYNKNDTASSSAMTVEHHFNFNRTSGAMNLSGARIVAGKEREWVGSASNQDGFLAFYTTLNETPGEKLRITSGGQVGIASAIPRTNFALDVNGDLSLGESNGTDNTYLDQKQNGDFHIINSGRDSNGVSGNMTGGAGGVAINRYNTIAGGTSQFRDFVVYNGKSTKVLMVDGSSGEVGIGTDNPTGAFEINWNGTSTDMLMFSRPETGGNFARLGHNTAGGTNMLDVRSEGHIRLLTGGNNERLRINSDGKIATGTAINTSNTYEFSVTGSDSNGGIYAHGRNHYLSNRSDAYASLTLKKSNADSDGIDYLQFRDSSNNLKGQITGAGNFKPISGGGIDFSAGAHAGGMSSELLNDYEEGTFTGGINDFNGTYVAQTGTYTKIGNVVTIQIMISGNGGSGSGSLILTSLPFASEGTPSSYRAVGAIHAHTGLVTGGKQVIGLMNNNENKIRIRTVQNNATTTDLNRNGLNTGGWELVIGMVYHTAS